MSCPHKHETSNGVLNRLPYNNSLLDLVPPWSAFSEALEAWAAATTPSTNSPLSSETAIAGEKSSGPYSIGLRPWFLLLMLVLPLLSASRKWPREGALLTFTASGVSLEQSENNQCLDLQFFLSFEASTVLLPLLDLRERLKMLDTPMRLPSVMPLSWNKDSVDWNQFHHKINKIIPTTQK